MILADLGIGLDTAGVTAVTGMLVAVMGAFLKRTSDTDQRRDATSNLVIQLAEKREQAAAAERDKAFAERDRAFAERDRVAVERDKSNLERDFARREVESLRRQLGRTPTDYSKGSEDG